MPIRSFLLLSTFLFSVTAWGAEFDIAKMGAKPDGKTLCTAIVQLALNKAAGGGTVMVPAGTYLIGGIEIKSHTTLRLEAGAVLLASPNLKDYPAHRWGHHEDRTPWHLIYAYKADGVRICGRGAIDGQGPAFWEKTRPHAWAFYREIEERPSPMVELEGCANLTVEGVTLRNSAGWTCHLLNCQTAFIRGVRIENTLFGPNTDGIDVTGSRQVVISDCIINTGDDAIALKTTEDSGPCEYITVTNCVLQTSCVALRIGYESRYDFRHIVFSNCVVPSASRVVDLRSIEGGGIEHVLVAGITGTTNSGWPINRVAEIYLDTIPNLYGIAIKEHPNYGKAKPILKTGFVRDITFRDLDIVTDGRILLTARAGLLAQDIRLENVRLRYAIIDPPNPLSIKANSVGYARAVPDARSAEAAVVAQNIDGLVIDGLTIHWPTYPADTGWHLLHTEYRHYTPTFYDNHEEDIRQGRRTVPFSAFWGRGLTNAKVDLRRAPASDKAKPQADVEAGVEVLK